MPKRVIVVCAAQAPGLSVPGAEVVRLDVAQADSGPACDVAVLLGDPSSQGSPEELARRNARWVRGAAAAIARRSPDCVLVIAARPVNALAWVALRASGLPRQRVLGVAGLAEARRLTGLLSQALGVGPSDIQVSALGGGGEGLVALPRLWSVNGIPAAELLCPEELRRVAQQACSASTPEELAAAAAHLTEALLGEGRRLCTCSLLLEGEYGIDGNFLAVPVLLRRSGVERVVQLNLKVAERMAVLKAAAAGRLLRSCLEVDP